MRPVLIAPIICTLVAGPAFAVGVPVDDAKRLDDATGIANCMTKVQGSTGSTVAPSQGVHKSVASPGSAKSAGQSASAGEATVTGSTGGSTAATTTNVGGVDLSPLKTDPKGVGSIETGAHAQHLASFQAVTTALPANSSALQSISGQIGQVAGIQGAWDQNSGVRLSGANVWNQALQVASTLADLRNQILLWQTATTSAQAHTMTYDRTKASFVAKTTAPAPDNQSSTSTAPTTLSEIQKELQAAEDAASQSIAPSGISLDAGR
jgi:hypothetical protein